MAISDEIKVASIAIFKPFDQVVKISLSMTPWPRNLPKSVLRVQSVCLHIRPVKFQFSCFRRHCMLA